MGGFPRFDHFEALRGQIFSVDSEEESCSVSEHLEEEEVRVRARVRV